MYWRTRGVIPHRVERAARVRGARLYLACISPVSRLHLPFISPTSPHRVERAAHVRRAVQHVVAQVQLGVPGEG